MQALADDITAFWQHVLRVVSAFNQYTIEKSTDGLTGWSVVQTITDMTLNQLTIIGETGYYRARARLKDGSFTDYSETTFLDFNEVEPPVGQRILIDFGGNGVADGGVADTGVMTPDNSITSGTPGQAADGLWWNNVVDCRAGTWITNPVDTANTAVTGFSISADKKPGGTFNNADYSMNFAGTNAAVGDYPASAVRDSCYFDPSAGLVTLTFDIPVGFTASVKFWGNRAAAGPRILQIRKVGEVTWLEYESANNTNYETSATIEGLTGTVGIECQIKSGSTFGYISIMDITLTTI